MNINVTATKVTIDKGSIVNKGEYNIRDCNFTLSEEYNGLVCKALFTIEKTKQTYEQSIVNNKCTIPYEVTVEKGAITLGVIGYEIEDDELIKRYSPLPYHFTIEDGSYIEDIENQSTPTPSELEQLEQRVSTIEIDAEQVEINTQDISDLQENKADKTELEDFITKDVNDLTYYTLTTQTGSQIELTLNSTNFKMTATLKDKNGIVVNTSNEIDLPLESVVVNASYDSSTKELVLTLQNGTTVRVSIADLVSGLQTEITSSNKLASDLVDDSTSTNKFVTASEKTQITTNKNNITSLNTNKEDKSNKVTSLNSSSTDTQYPSAKAVYDNLANKADKSSLVTGTGENITLQNTAELEFIKPPLPRGNSEQDTAILPTGYTQLDYIESTGTQWIDTNVINNGYKSEIEIAWTDLSKTRQIMGSEIVGFWGVNNNKYEIYQISNYEAVQNRWDKVIFQVTQDGTHSYRYLTVNGNVLFNGQTSTTLPARHIYIFNIYNNEADSTCCCKIKYQRIWNNEGTLVRNFVPCKNANNEVGLYDLVSKTFFGNLGTGTFVAGNVATVPIEAPITNVTGDVEVLVQNKNLFDGISEPGYYNSSGIYFNNASNRITDFYQINENIQITASVNSGFLSLTFYYFDKNKNYISSNTVRTNKTSITDTTPAECKYIKFGSNLNNSTMTDTTLTEYELQIEQNTTATTYTPHKEQTLPLTLGDIELCKIGDYQDYFYKENSKWYLYKAINKVEITAENVDSLVGGLNTTTYSKPYITITKSLLGWKSSWTQNISLINNYSVITSTSKIESGTYAVNFIQSYLIIFDDRFTDLATAKQLLIGTIIYIVLATPTSTEITDTTLIEQLDAISNVLSYEEQTNISGSSDESNPLFEVEAVQYKEPDYWTIAYVNGQIGNAIGGAY